MNVAIITYGASSPCGEMIHVHIVDENYEEVASFFVFDEHDVGEVLEVYNAVVG